MSPVPSSRLVKAHKAILRGDVREDKTARVVHVRSRTRAAVVHTVILDCNLRGDGRLVDKCDCEAHERCWHLVSARAAVTYPALVQAASPAL